MRYLQNRDQPAILEPIFGQNVVQRLGQILLTRRWHARHSQLAILVDIDMDTASGDIEGVEPGRQREESVEHVELESDGSQGYAHRRM